MIRVISANRVWFDISNLLSAKKKPGTSYLAFLFSARAELAQARDGNKKPGAGRSMARFLTC